MKSKKISYFKYFSLLFAIVVLVFIAGCTGAPPAVPIINSFSADPLTITAGESSNLSWSVTDATTVTIDNGIDSVTLSGTTTVTPATTTTYTLKATNSTGSVTASITIAVGLAFGSIDIISTPAGAKVYLDGVDTGRTTPTIFNNVVVGDHMVRLSYYHYKDWEDVVNVIAEQTTYLNAILTLAPEAIITIQPGIIDGKDSFVNNYYPTDNFGDSHTAVYVGKTTDLFWIYRSYLQFDLSSVPPNAVILDADLVLYHHFSSVISSLPIGLYEVTESWEENIITWNNQPASSTEVEDILYILAGLPGYFVSWDIEGLVKGWHDGIITNYGMVLRDTDESSVDGKAAFRSSENMASDRPRLIIEYYIP